MVVYQDAGNDHEARLIAYLAGNGLPFLPVSEQRVLLEWDNGPGRIFRWRMNGDGDCDA